MKKLIVLFLLLALLLNGCTNLGGLMGMAAAGYGIYRAVKSD